VALDLTDAISRLEWAQADSQTLVDAMRSFRQSDPYTTWLHQDGERWYWTHLRRISEESEFLALSNGARLFGSFLDHMRASLNYLTYQLALLSISEDPTLQGQLNPEAIEFPIFDVGSAFRTNNRVKRLPQKYFDRLEKVQPYNGGNHGLWILHELAREYRHRVVHPVACYPFGSVDGIFSENLPPTAEDVDIVYTGGALKHGDDLCSFIAPLPMNPQDYPKIVIAISIDNPVCQELTLVDVLNTISVDVVSVLSDWNGAPVMELMPSVPG